MMKCGAVMQGYTWNEQSRSDNTPFEFGLCAVERVAAGLAYEVSLVFLGVEAVVLSRRCAFRALQHSLRYACRPGWRKRRERVKTGEDDGYRTYLGYIDKIDEYIKRNLRCYVGHDTRTYR